MRRELQTVSQDHGRRGFGESALASRRAVVVGRCFQVES